MSDEVETIERYKYEHVNDTIFRAWLRAGATRSAVRLTHDGVSIAVLPGDTLVEVAATLRAALQIANDEPLVSAACAKMTELLLTGKT